MSINNFAQIQNTLYPNPSPAPQALLRNSQGVLDAFGTVVPVDGTAGFVTGATFKLSTGGVKTSLYVNEGSVTSSNFNVVDEVPTAFGSASGVGPSPLIWEGAPVLESLLDPTKGFLYFDDYLGPINGTPGDGYVITTVTTGGIAPVATEQGGVLLVDSAGNATADDGVNVQLQNCMFKPVANTVIYFEARVKMNDTSAVISQFYIGLAGVDNTLIAAGVLDDVVDKAGFYRQGATTGDRLSVVAARTSAEDVDVDKVTVADDTFIKLGFKINGIDSIEWYADGVLVHTSSVAANIPNAVMCLSYVAQTEGASKDAELSIDWVRVLQTGGRA